MVDVSTLPSSPAEGDPLHDEAHALIHQALKLIDAAGDLLIGDGVDSIVRLAKGTARQALRVNAAGTTLDYGLPLTAIEAAATASVLTNEATTSSTFVDLATVGPAVTVTPGPSGKVLVILASVQTTTSSGSPAQMGVALSGGNTVAATGGDTTDSRDSFYGLSERTLLFTGLAAVSTTFTAKYTRAAGSGTANFSARKIIVLPL